MNHNSKLDIVKTFIELGDATSHNLEFSHCKEVFVSYGEETITETNLLEIRRRHPNIVRVILFQSTKKPRTEQIGNGVSSAEN